MDEELHEVMGGCQVCGKRMLTHRSPLHYRTCDECKAKQRREASRRLAARRKAERHAIKQTMGVTHCERCGKPIEDAARLSAPARETWARKYCGNACRQAAFRDRQRASKLRMKPRTRLKVV
jgi:hypothetical protein